MGVMGTMGIMGAMGKDDEQRRMPRKRKRRTCFKRKLRSRMAALKALNTFMESDDEKRHEQRIYFCRECRAWHLTSKEAF